MAIRNRVRRSLLAALAAQALLQGEQAERLPGADQAGHVHGRAAPGCEGALQCLHGGGALVAQRQALADVLTRQATALQQAGAVGGLAAAERLDGRLPRLLGLLALLLLLPRRLLGRLVRGLPHGGGGRRRGGRRFGLLLGGGTRADGGGGIVYAAHRRLLVTQGFPCPRVVAHRGGTSLPGRNTRPAESGLRHSAKAAGSLRRASGRRQAPCGHFGSQVVARPRDCPPARGSAPARAPARRVRAAAAPPSPWSSGAAGRRGVRSGSDGGREAGRGAGGGCREAPRGRPVPSDLP
jgi:hypothetical protein